MAESSANADGGADVTALVKKLSDRMVMWHINDRGCRKQGPFITPILKEDAAELGTGNMALGSILETVQEAAKVKAIVLETHKNWIDNDPIKSLTLSAQWFKKNKLISS